MADIFDNKGVRAEPIREIGGQEDGTQALEEGHPHAE